MEGTVATGLFSLAGVTLGAMLPWLKDGFTRRQSRKDASLQRLEDRRRAEWGHWSAFHGYVAEPIEEGDDHEGAVAMATGRRQYMAAVLGDPPEGDLPDAVFEAVKTIRHTVVEQAHKWQESLANGDDGRSGTAQVAAIYKALGEFDNVARAAQR